MKLSQLIEVLQDVQKYEGDGYIWSFEVSAPLPRDIKIEMVGRLERTDFGAKSPKGSKSKNLDISLEYEDGVDVLDRSIEEGWGG